MKVDRELTPRSGTSLEAVTVPVRQGIERLVMSPMPLWAEWPILRRTFTERPRHTMGRRVIVVELTERVTPMMWTNGMGWGGWLLMALATIAFWGVVVFGVVSLFRGTGRGPSRMQDQQSGHGAEQILDERFARGEIDAEEYRARQAVLHGAAR